MSSLAFSTSSDSGEAVLSVVGEIDISNGIEFEIRLRQLPSPSDGGRCLVDMSGVSFMDSSGVHSLYNATNAPGGNGRIRLRNPSPGVCRVIEVTVPSLLVDE